MNMINCAALKRAEGLGYSIGMMMYSCTMADIVSAIYERHPNLTDEELDKRIQEVLVELSKEDMIRKIVDSFSNPDRNQLSLPLVA